MPRATPRENVADQRDEQRPARLAEFAAGFQPSKHKPQNVWRRHEGQYMCVFAQDEDGPFKWVVTEETEGEKRYSDDSFDTRGEAVESLFFEFVDEFWK